MSSYQDCYNKLREDPDAIKPIADRDEGTAEERSKEHYREFKARETAICEDKGLTDAQSRVLWRLLLHFNHKTGQCDPSLRGLAERLGYSPATIVNAVKAGQARGHLDWPSNPGGTKRRNQYVILKPNDQDTQTFNGARTLEQSTPIERSRPKRSMQAERSAPSTDAKRSTAASGTFNGGETERSTATQQNVQPPSTRTTERELLKENYEFNRPHQFASLPDGGPCAKGSGSEVREARKVRKRVVTPEVRLEAIRTEASTVCTHCGVADGRTMPLATPRGPAQLHAECQTPYMAENFPPPPPPVESDADPLVWPPDPNKQPFLN